MTDSDLNTLLRQLVPAPPPYPPVPLFLLENETALKEIFKPTFRNDILLDSVSWGVGVGISRIIRQALSQLKIPGAKSVEI